MKAARNAGILLATVLISSCFSPDKPEPLPDVFAGCFSSGRGQFFEIIRNELYLMPRKDAVAHVNGAIFGNHVTQWDKKGWNAYMQISHEIWMSGQYLVPGRNITVNLPYREDKSGISIAVASPDKGHVWFQKVTRADCENARANFSGTA